MMKKVLNDTNKYIIIILVCILISGCTHLSNTNTNTNMDTNTNTNMDTNTNTNMDTNTNTDMDTNTNIDTKVNTDTDVPSNLSDYISKAISLSDDKEIEYQEWIDEEKTCYRVAIKYKEEQNDQYTHCEDYFFFINDDDIVPIHVDYSKENPGVDRYVWNACDFDAYLDDVTFDGNKDLIISLGHAGAGGDLVYCAYVYKDGEYVYTKSFESIVNYKLDKENKCVVREDDYAQAFIYDGNSFVEKLIN